MAMSTYKVKRLLCFMLTGVIGPLVCFGLFFLQFPLMGILFWSMLVSVIVAIVGFILTGLNPWIKAIQGDAIIAIDVNSTGVGKFYVCKVITNPTGGIDLNIDFGNGESETRVYDRKITHRIQAPQQIFMWPWKRKASQVPVVEKVEEVVKKEEVVFNNTVVEDL